MLGWWSTIQLKEKSEYQEYLLEGVGWEVSWEGGSRGRETYLYLWLIHVEV